MSNEKTYNVEFFTYRLNYRDGQEFEQEVLSQQILVEEVSYADAILAGVAAFDAKDKYYHISKNDADDPCLTYYNFEVIPNDPVERHDWAGRPRVHSSVGPDRVAMFISIFGLMGLAFKLSYNALYGKMASGAWRVIDK